MYFTKKSCFKIRSNAYLDNKGVNMKKNLKNVLNKRSKIYNTKDE